MIKRMKLEDGMNVLKVNRWGKVHVWVKNGCVVSMTIYNAKKKSCRTTKATGSREDPSNHYVSLELETKGGQS